MRDSAANWIGSVREFRSPQRLFRLRGQSASAEGVGE